MKCFQIRYWQLTGILLLVFVMVCSCTKSDDESKKTAKYEKLHPDSIQMGGIYQVPLLHSPSSLDPAYVKDWYGEAVAHQIFEGLVQFGPYLNVLPALAKTWQVDEDGKVFRFELRQDAYFHNGRIVSVEDVIFSLIRLLRVNPPPVILPHLLKITGAQEYREQEIDHVIGLKQVNDRVLTINLVQAHAPFLTALGMYQAAIVPREEVLREDIDFSQNPIGSGPFRFVSWLPDKKIKLQRFKKYHAGAAFLDGIIFRIYPGRQTEEVLSDFRKGVLEEMPVYGNIRNEVSSIKNIQFFRRPSLSLFFYGLNCNHSHLKNPQFRYALLKTLDRQKIVTEVYQNQFEIADTILPPGMPGYKPIEQSIQPDSGADFQKIKQTLTPDIVPREAIEIVSAYQSPRVERELDLVQKFWARLGISLKVKYITDWSEFEAYLKSDSVQIYRYAWFADMPDSDSFLYPLFASQSSVNFTRYQNLQVDQLLDEAREIVDPVKRAKIYQKIEELTMASTPIIPLFYLSIDRVYQPNVQGIQISALGAHTMPLHRVWLKPAAESTK